jgi:hypothetical protein
VQYDGWERDEQMCQPERQGKRNETRNSAT